MGSAASRDLTRHRRHINGDKDAVHTRSFPVQALNSRASVELQRSPPACTASPPPADAHSLLRQNTGHMTSDPHG